MKKNLARLVLPALFFLCVCNVQAQNDSLNMSKIGGWSDNTFGTYYNDIWGFEKDGREYAIMGSNHSTYFIDVTDDTPVLVGAFPGSSNDVVWRDYKVNGDYAYGVADGNDTNSLQIFDLSGVPDTIIKVYDSLQFTNSCHNIFIDNDRLYMGINKRDGGSYALDILSISDPEKPTFAGNVPSTFFGGSAIHDIYVRNDTAFCSGEYTGLYIMDLISLNAPKLITSITTYADQGYNHSSWLSDNGKTMVMADEVPNGLALKLFDISDITSPIYLTQFESNDAATPHNPFFEDGYIFVSYYHDGVQVFDPTDVRDVKQVAYYDTYPDNNNSPDPYPDREYEGCWGVYPFLPSGKIIASDITYGLFVLESNLSPLGVMDNKFKGDVEVYPNPTASKVVVRTESRIKNISIYNSVGQRVIDNELKNAYISEMDLSELPAGNYKLMILTGENTVEQRTIQVGNR